MTFKEWLKTSRYKDQDPLSVTVIDCFNKDLTDLKGIEEFKNLEELCCSDNKLTSLKEIEQLTSLKEIDCSGNELTSLRGIEKLTNLNTLYCQYNNLTSLKGIECLNNLEILNCYCYSYNNQLEHKNYSNIFKSIKEYQKYLKRFYRKDKIKNLYDIQKLVKKNG